MATLQGRARRPRQMLASRARHHEVCERFVRLHLLLTPPAVAATSKQCCSFSNARKGRRPITGLTSECPALEGPVAGARCLAGAAVRARRDEVQLVADTPICKRKRIPSSRRIASAWISTRTAPHPANLVPDCCRGLAASFAGMMEESCASTCCCVAALVLVLKQRLPEGVRGLQVQI